jgi:two-component system OmpR family sensor kinase
MRRFIFGVILSIGIIVLGFGLALLADRQLLPNPLFAATYQIDLAGIIGRLGLGCGGLTLGFFLVLWGIDRYLQRKKFEMRKEQVASQQRFFQRLDHEMKNPLTIMRLGIVNLQHSTPLSDEQGASLARISQQVQRLQKLVVDLRLLNDLDSTSIERKPINLPALLDESIALSSQATGETPPRIILSVQQVPWPVSDVLGDRDLLVLVFRNLLDNALKFSPADQAVEVRVSEDGNTAIVDIVDAGSGIPAEEISQIFDELYRGENARGIPGSGLGLKLVERIVALHNGAIHVRSKPEKGSVFTVRLPLLQDVT